MIAGWHFNRRRRRSSLRTSDPGSATRKKLKRNIDDAGDYLEDAGDYLKEQAEKLSKEAQKAIQSLEGVCG